jgi:hypothetical protein
MAVPRRITPSGVSRQIKQIALESNPALICMGQFLSGTGQSIHANVSECKWLAGTRCFFS